MATKTKPGLSRGGELRPQVENVPPGRAVATGRDGKPIWRRITDDADPYYIDPAIVEPGWTYEWKRHATLNQEDRGYQAQLGQMGWSPVPAERHPGMFMPLDETGPIRRNGMILMERPTVLTEEARAEQHARAVNRLRQAKRLHGSEGVAQGDGRVVVTRANTFTREQVESVASIAKELTEFE